MVNLPPQSFPYNKYDSGTIPYELATSSMEEFLEWLGTQLIIGYIKGIELEIRPRTDTYGVLIEEEETGYETWAHVPDDIFEAFLEECK